MFVCEREGVEHVDVVNLREGIVQYVFFGVSQFELMEACVSECRGCWV